MDNKCLRNLIYAAVSQDPSLPINLDYSPELDPEINGFLREHQQPHHKQTSHRGTSRNPDGRGSVSTHCELRLILDGLEKLGFQLVTTASYSFQGRAHNEFIMHRELAPVMDHTHEMKHKEKQHLSVPEKNKKKNKDKNQKQHRHRDRSSSSSDQSMDDRNNRRKTDPSTPAHHKSKNHQSSSAPFHSQQSQLYY